MAEFSCLRGTFVGQDEGFPPRLRAAGESAAAACRPDRVLQRLEPGPHTGAEGPRGHTKELGGPASKGPEAVAARP